MTWIARVQREVLQGAGGNRSTAGNCDPRSCQVRAVYRIIWDKGTVSMSNLRQLAPQEREFV
jgi:hypothetical protein